MTTNVVRIRAGSLPAQDTRNECRAIHRITHTSTPAEREYDQFNTSILEDFAPILLAAAFTFAAFVGVVYLINR